jgi:glycosyltransferase involved in cell wall biosynthesis
MKIVYITPHLSTGGLPQYLLKKIQVLNQDVSVYCIEYQDLGGFVVQKEQVIDLLKDRFFRIGDNKDELIKLIDSVSPDVVHLEEMPEYFMDRRIAEKIYSKDRKYLIFETSHDSSFDPNQKLFIPDKFLFVSKFQKQRMSSLSVSSDVLEYPIGLKSRKNRTEILKKLGLDPDKKHVVNVGLFTPRKNQAEIFQYAKLLKDKNIQFHFIGNQADNFRFYWEPLMKEIPSNCKWWGERKDVENFYSIADLFLFTSRGTENNKETSPLVIREAVSFNVPSLIYNLPVYLGMYDKYENISYLNFHSLSENCGKILEKLSLYDARDGFKNAKSESCLFIVSSYPNDSSSAKITKECLEELGRFNLPRILTSHCDVPANVQESCEYSFIDKERNILTHQSFYIRYWQILNKNGANYKTTLFLDTSLNDTYHGPAVYTNYYNGISLAKKLGYKKAICLNFDFIMKDGEFFKKVYKNLKNKDGYFVNKQEPEGGTLKTVFFGIDVDFFENNFPLIKNKEDYESWRQRVGSESNGLENIFFNTLKHKLSGCEISSNDDYVKDTSSCEVDSNSQVEYFTVLPINSEPDKISIFFCSSNTKDNRRVVITYPFGKIESDINGKTTVVEFIKKPENPCEIRADVYDKNTSGLIYTRKINIDEQYLKEVLNKNGLVEKL